ncbi:hypothetical protein ARMGADRAFT_1084878 [Armillaria gallica]|uniref:Uncharacterized protein n=1 Tax=Armillaria gallica TaxID=47427 RepID=A0A2H3D2D2_ARMGA|nr:hypothetical protein ARMGADRAFT_1084878 [Armillaria gallica]
MSESIASIHLCASQSTPPFHHLSDDSFAFPDSLAPLVLPVDPVDIADTDTRKVTRLWPSSVPLFTFKEHSHLQARKDHIIELLKHGRNRKLRNGLRTASALTHNQYTKIFPEEMSILDYLLTSISACTTFAKDVVYKLDENIYQEFLTRLTTRRSLASSSLETFGYPDLRPPVWAIDTGKGLTANDFEIYALQYRIRIEHFLYMLDNVHDWDRCQTRVILDESLLATQRNADRARLGKQERYLPTVPPASHSNSLKSNPSRQSSASDWSLGGVHYDTSRDKEQHPSNLQTTKIRGQSCLCANSKVSESHDFPGPCRHEILPAASRKVQTPNGLDCKNPSSPAIFYQGRPPSHLDSGQGHTDGNKHLFHHDSCNPQISACSDHSEFPSIHFDTTLKAVDICTIEHSSPNTGISCEKRCNDTPVPNNNISTPLLHHSNSNELRTFRIASNTLCTPFSEKNKNFRLPRQVRRRIRQLQKQLQRVFHITGCVTSTNSDYQRTLMGMRKYVAQLSKFIILESETTRLQVGVNILDLNVFQKVLDSRPYLTRNSRTELQMFSVWPKARVEQTMNVMEQTGRTRCQLHSLGLAGHRIDVEKATASLTINQKCRSYRWRDFNCCHPKYRRVRREVETQGYSMMSPGCRIKVEVNIKPQTTRRKLFFKQHIRRETHQHQGYDSPYHFVSPSTLRISSIGSFITAVGTWNTIGPVRLPRKLFHIICRGSQRIKRRPCDNRKSQHIRTAYNSHQLTIRINAQTILDAASKQLGVSASGRESLITFSRCIPSITFTLANRKLREFMVHQALRQGQNSRFPAIRTVLLDVINGLRYRQQPLQRTRCSPRLEFLCQLTPEIRISLTTVRGWNATSPVHIPGKRFCGIGRGSERMKQRPCSTRKRRCVRMMRDPRQLVIIIHTQLIPHTAFEDFSITSESGRKFVTTSFHYLLSFNFISAGNVFGDFLGHRAFRELCNSQCPAIHMVLWDLATRISDRQQLLQRIRRSPHLEILTEVTVVKQESERLPTYRPQCVAFNTLSPKLNWTEKTEHDQLIQCVLLIHSSDDVPSNRFITSIAVSSDFISGTAETSFLACSTSLAPTAPGPSADDTKVLGFKSRIRAPGDEMDNSETSRQCQKLDTISNVNGMMAGSIRRRNDGAHHQYRSRLGNGPHKPAAHADSQLLRMQHRASSTRILHEPNLGAYNCGNHFEFTIIVDSGHSLTGPDRAPKLDFNLILDPSMYEKSMHDGILECSEPCPPYVEDVG